MPTGGTAAGVFCTHASADDLSWAQRVWRSLRRDGTAEGLGPT
ncbi:hypothetical protein [Streptomyces chromofuscus]|nr:hypothetical protein [Streptomyces chromofuscus]